MGIFEKILALLCQNLIQGFHACLIVNGAGADTMKSPPWFRPWCTQLASDNSNVMCSWPTFEKIFGKTTDPHGANNYVRKPRSHILNGPGVCNRMCAISVQSTTSLMVCHINHASKIIPQRGILRSKQIYSAQPEEQAAEPP